MKLLIISGLSGSGKSIALQALEDFGFYCVDNLPVSLLPEFAAQMAGDSGRDDISDVAVGIDARNVTGDLQDFQQILQRLTMRDLSCEVIFLEADDNALLKRFSETRRRHPLTGHGLQLSEAISNERRLLAPLSDNADLRIDTTYMNIHQLRSLIRDRVAHREGSMLSLQFVSFAFKHGVPADADFVFDVRCLPNPYWDPRLREFTGQHTEVVAFLENDSLVKAMCQDISAFLRQWLGHFNDQSRSYMTIAIGCTGGQHRSVYVAEFLASRFQDTEEDVLVRHRELL